MNSHALELVVQYAKEDIAVSATALKESVRDMSVIMDRLQEENAALRRSLTQEATRNAKLEYYSLALDRIGAYCVGTEFKHVSDFVLRVKRGEEKSL